MFSSYGPQLLSTMRLYNRRSKLYMGGGGGKGGHDDCHVSHIWCAD